MKKAPLIIILSIIILSLAAIIFFIAEPYLKKRHQKLAEPIFKEAEALYANGRFSDALKKYKKIVDDYYKSSYTFESLKKTVDIFDRYRKRKLQFEYLEKFVDDFKNKRGSAQYIYKLGNITLMLKGDENKALEYFRIVINNFPGTDWAKKASDRMVDIAIRIYPPEKVLNILNENIDNIPDGERKDLLNLKKMEILWKKGKVREAYEVTAEISRPLKDYVKDNLIFNQLLVREEPTYKHLQSLADVYQKLGFPEKADAVRKKALSKKETAGNK